MWEKTPKRIGENIVKNDPVNARFTIYLGSRVCEMIKFAVYCHLLRVLLNHDSNQSLFKLQVMPHQNNRPRLTTAQAVSSCTRIGE